MSPFPACPRRQCRPAVLLSVALLATGVASAAEAARDVLVLTSTNAASGNSVVVFKLSGGTTAALTYLDTLATGGRGGAGGNAGILQFKDGRGAVANYGSDTVTALARDEAGIRISGTVHLPNGCVKPDSVALSRNHLLIAGATCAESHGWPGGALEQIVPLSDPSAAQIAAGDTWAALTMTSGSVWQLPLTASGALSGAATAITLPPSANNTPLGEAFWGDTLGFTPAHSPDSFAIVNRARTVFPVTGPTPPFPTNAPCWVAKGAGNIWYTANSPGHAISIFFSDGAGGVFYKSVPLPGGPTDITVSHDGHWLAVIYSAGGDAHVAVFAVDGYGDLSPAADSDSVGASAFSGVAFSE